MILLSVSGFLLKITFGSVQWIIWGDEDWPAVGPVQGKPPIHDAIVLASWYFNDAWSCGYVNFPSLCF